MAGALKGDVGTHATNVDGLNQLYGDGAVRWSYLAGEQVYQGSPEVGQVTLAGVDYFFYAFGE